MASSGSNGTMLVKCETKSNRVKAHSCFSVLAACRSRRLCRACLAGSVWDLAASSFLVFSLIFRLCRSFQPVAMHIPACQGLSFHPKLSWILASGSLRNWFSDDRRGSRVWAWSSRCTGRELFDRLRPFLKELRP